MNLSFTNFPLNGSVRKQATCPSGSLTSPLAIAIGEEHLQRVCIHAGVEFFEIHAELESEPAFETRDYFKNWQGVPTQKGGGCPGVGEESSSNVWGARYLRHLCSIRHPRQ